MSADNVPSDRLKGFSMWFDREQWGVIIDALIQHRGHADSRKTINSESTSDLRADMCADLIGQLNVAASDTGADNVPSVEALSKSESAAMDLWWTVTGDDWAVPDWLPAKFLAAALRGPEPTEEP